MSLSPKPYTINFDEKPEYLYAHIIADRFTVEIALEYMREVFAECRELQYKKILIKRDIPEVLPTDATMDVATKLADLDIHDLKIAVADPLLENRELNRMSAVASRGYGIRVRIYSTVHEARRWLLYE